MRYRMIHLRSALDEMNDPSCTNITALINTTTKQNLSATFRQECLASLSSVGMESHSRRQIIDNARADQSNKWCMEHSARQM